MTITIGKYKTRDGRNAEVTAIEGHGSTYYPVRGTLNGAPCAWAEDGSYMGEYPDMTSGEDLMIAVQPGAFWKEYPERRDPALEMTRASRRIMGIQSPLLIGVKYAVFGAFILILATLFWALAFWSIDKQEERAEKTRIEKHAK